jgi:hypothetical protein
MEFMERGEPLFGLHCADYTTTQHDNPYHNDKFPHLTQMAEVVKYFRFGNISSRKDF